MGILINLWIVLYVLSRIRSFLLSFWDKFVLNKIQNFKVFPTINKKSNHYITQESLLVLLNKHCPKPNSLKYLLYAFSSYLKSWKERDIGRQMVREASSGGSLTEGLQQSVLGQADLGVQGFLSLLCVTGTQTPGR